jgi:hypothetical protein
MAVVSAWFCSGSSAVAYGFVGTLYTVPHSLGVLCDEARCHHQLVAAMAVKPLVQAPIGRILLKVYATAVTCGRHNKHISGVHEDSVYAGLLESGSQQLS